MYKQPIWSFIATALASRNSVLPGKSGPVPRIELAYEPTVAHWSFVIMCLVWALAAAGDGDIDELGDGDDGDASIQNDAENKNENSYIKPLFSPSLIQIIQSSRGFIF